MARGVDLDGDADDASSSATTASEVTVLENR